MSKELPFSKPYGLVFSGAAGLLVVLGIVLFLKGLTSLIYGTDAIAALLNAGLVPEQVFWIFLAMIWALVTGMMYHSVLELNKVFRTNRKGLD